MALQQIGKYPYSTSQVAKITNLSVRTICRCFDNGLLKGFRLPIGRRERRVPHENLRRFMIEHNLPMDNLEGARHG